jgi:hypothetical protein
MVANSKMIHLDGCRRLGLVTSVFREVVVFAHPLRADLNPTVYSLVGLTRITIRMAVREMISDFHFGFPSKVEYTPASHLLSQRVAFFRCVPPSYSVKRHFRLPQYSKTNKSHFFSYFHASLSVPRLLPSCDFARTQPASNRSPQVRQQSFPPSPETAAALNGAGEAHDRP